MYYKLQELIYEEYPFIKEKDLDLQPWSTLTFNEYKDEDGNINYTEIYVHVFANIDPDDWEKLNSSESKIIKQLLEEITAFYHNRLDTIDIVVLTPLTEEELISYKDVTNSTECNFVKTSFYYYW